LAAAFDAGVDVTQAVRELKVRGYCVIERCLNSGLVDALFSSFTAEFESYVARVPAGNGLKRYGMPLPFRAPFSLPEVAANPVVLSVIEPLLGGELACSWFLSDTPLPGSSYQHAHSDVRPLFPDVDVTLPPFAYVVNVPLVDFTERNAPLEVWPATHLVGDPSLVPVADFARIDEHLAGPLQALADKAGGTRLLVPAGAALIRDLRMWHRGTPNTSDRARPMLALIYNRPWYHHRVIEMTEAEFAGLDPAVQRLFAGAIRRSKA
jgi:hypothetical protein